MADREAARLWLGCVRRVAKVHLKCMPLPRAMKRCVFVLRLLRRGPLLLLENKFFSQRVRTDAWPPRQGQRELITHPK